eukprot:164545_1
MCYHLLRILLAIIYPIAINCTTYELNIEDKYGSITQSTIAKGISDARSIFNNAPNDVVILIINNGTYNIGGDNSYGIDLTQGIKPGDNGGRFIIQGQGMNKTTLIFTDLYQDQISGENVFHTTFQDMHITRNKYTVTQGTIHNVSISEQYVDLMIHYGYPTPISLISPTKPQGLYIRRYTNSLTDPHIYVYNNSQIPWLNATLIDENENIWRLYVRDNNKQLIYYKIGQYVGIKSKHDGNTYRFCKGNDIEFKNIKWTQSTRGVLRCNVSNVLFDGINVVRSPAIKGQTPCMSSNAGGPQMNQEDDPMAHNCSVWNSYFECTGDDSIAFFNVTNGQVHNTYIRDSFAGGIYINNVARNICGAN